MLIQRIVEEEAPERGLGLVAKAPALGRVRVGLADAVVEQLLILHVVSIALEQALVALFALLVVPEVEDAVSPRRLRIPQRHIVVIEMLKLYAIVIDLPELSVIPLRPRLAAAAVA